MSRVLTVLYGLLNHDTIMSRLFDLVPYLLAGLTILLAFLDEFRKEAQHSEQKWPRRIVLACLAGVAILTFISVSEDKNDKAKSEGNIRELEAQVKTANDVQSDNTKLFLNYLSNMSKEVADLKTQVRTEALQKKLASVQADLEKTQKALAPGPKAELTFSFVPYESTPGSASARASSETTLPLASDGSVHVEFTILNLTQVDAANVELQFQICDFCKYVKEPSGMSKLQGMQDTQRYFSLPHLQPMQAYQTTAVDVIPPPRAAYFKIGFSYRCTSCVLPKDASTGIVHILGR